MLSTKSILTFATHTGTEYTDTVELGPGLSVRGQSIGVALYSEGFAPYDGILGYVWRVLRI